MVLVREKFIELANIEAIAGTDSPRGAIIDLPMENP